MNPRLTIPPDVAADVAARPEAYRPYPTSWPRADAVEVLLLDRANAGTWGPVGGWFTDYDVPVSVALCSDGNRAPGADVWALVGSVDGGPRPNVGDRVLVERGNEWRVTVVYSVADANTAGLWCGGSIEGFYVTRWAILPPAPERCTCPLDPDDDTNGPPEAFTLGSCPIHGIGTTTGGTAHLNWPPPTTTGGTARVLPPGALPATQLDTGPPVVAIGPNGPICGNESGIGSIRCTFPPGHPPIVGPDGVEWDHGLIDDVPQWRDIRDQLDAGPHPVRPWRLGASWARHAGPLVTVVEVGTGPPNKHGRRPDDRLIAAMLRADAEHVIAAVNYFRGTTGENP